MVVHCVRVVICKVYRSDNVEPVVASSLKEARCPSPVHRLVENVDLPGEGTGNNSHD